MDTAPVCHVDTTPACHVDTLLRTLSVLISCQVWTNDHFPSAEDDPRRMIFTPILKLLQATLQAIR